VIENHFAFWLIVGASTKNDDKTSWDKDFPLHKAKIGVQY
jgi:hypothetical protein